MTKNNAVYGLMANDTEIIEDTESVVLSVLDDVREQTGNLAERIQEMIEGRDQFEYTDLKLHDVASYVGEDKDDLFTLFCEEQLQVWKDRLVDSDLSTRYIYRTSSFYITSDVTGEYDALESFYEDWHFEREVEDVIIAVNDGLVGYSPQEIDVIRNMVDAIKKGTNFGTEELMESYAGIYTSEEEYKEEAENLAYTILDLLDELGQSLDYVEERLDAVAEAYLWLEDYKEEQIEIYKEWLKEYEDATQ